MPNVSMLANLPQRQDELKRRMLRAQRLSQLAFGSLERALTLQESDTRDQQLKQASAVAIPTMKGIGEFQSDAQSPTIVIGSPPAEMLARWASQPLEDQTQPLGLAEPPAPTTP